MTMVSPDDGRPSVSRTARYKKVTKPLLERKRRARINRCLDELKDLMVGAFEVEGDNISKLEKADILELTVRHLTKLHSPQDPAADVERFQAGFGQCATEACQFILSMPGVDSQVSQSLVRHLSAQVAESPRARQPFSPPASPQAWPRPDSADPPSSLASSPRDAPPAMPSVDYVTRHRRYCEPDSPHVPVNKSLVCDISMSHPVPVGELSHPSAGLLMTVDDDTKPSPAHVVGRNPEMFRNGGQRVEDRMIQDLKSAQGLETKHVIMKKIRDQILERQVRESEIRDVSISSARDLHLQTSPSYRRTMQNDGPAVRMPFPQQIEPVSSTSVDPRMRSKAETKQYPTSYDGVSIGYGPRESTDRSPIAREQPGVAYPQSYSQSAQPDIHIDRRLLERAHKIRPESSEDELELQHSNRKRKADYRSIHPKKRMIRSPHEDKVPPKYIKHPEETINIVLKPSIPTEHVGRSALRDQRPGYSAVSGESYQHYQSRLLPEDYRMPRRSVPPPAQNEPGGPQTYRPSQEDRRQYYLAEMRGQQARQQILNNDQDDMWRPW